MVRNSVAFILSLPVRNNYDENSYAGQDSSFQEMFRGQPLKGFVEFKPKSDVVFQGQMYLLNCFFSLNNRQRVGPLSYIASH